MAVKRDKPILLSADVKAQLDELKFDYRVKIYEDVIVALMDKARKYDEIKSEKDK